MTSDEAFASLLRAMGQHFSVRLEHKRALAREALAYAVRTLGCDVAQEELDLICKEDKR